MPDSLFQRLIKDISTRTGRPVAEDAGPPAARFTESIEVPGNVTSFETQLPPRDRMGRLDPKRMAEIHLGSATAPPVGTYLPPDAPGTTTDLPPQLGAAWSRIKGLYPSVARYANIQTNRGLAGTNTLGQVEPDSSRTIQINPTMEYLRPEMQDDTLRHELVHVANSLNTLKEWPDSLPISEQAAGFSEQNRQPQLEDLLRALDQYRAAERARSLQGMALTGLRGGPGAR